MAHEIIEHYLKDILDPRLNELGVVGASSDVIETAVCEQMLSCIFHWNDEPFRKAILVVGEDEGAFYLRSVPFPKNQTTTDFPIAENHRFPSCYTISRLPLKITRYCWPLDQQ